MGDIDTSIFYDIRKALSYNALLTFIVGERGVGKSYSAKDYVATHFIKKHKQFAYIRRYKTELKEALIKKGSYIFWNQILNQDKYKNHKFSNNNELLYIDGEIARLCNAIIYC